MANPLEGPLCQAEFVFIVYDLDAGLRLMNEHAAVKGVNEEQTASLVLLC